MICPFYRNPCLEALDLTSIPGIAIKTTVCLDCNNKVNS